MAYLDDEKSDFSGQPNELYKFAGSFQSYFYTTGPRPVTFLGDTYQPMTMQRSEIAAGTQEDDGLSITVELPISNPMVQAYAFQIAPPMLRLTIYRYHDVGSYISYWNGFVGQIKVNGGRATLRSPSILEWALSAAIPNVYYQSICNHVLFDERCKVLEAAWSQAATITSVVGRTLIISTIGTLDGVLLGGTARLSNGEERMIVAQSGTTITVNFPFSSAAAAGALTVTAGCNHDSDCISRFTNGINFGGFKYIPPENVFESGIEPGQTAIADDSCLPHIPVFEGWYLIFRQFIYAPSPPLASNSRGSTALDVDGAANFNVSTPCRAFGSGTTSRCDGNDATGTWRDYRYDYDVLAAVSGQTLYLQHQYSFGTHITNARLQMQYRRWFDPGFTTIMGGTGSGTDATTPVNGSFDLNDTFPRDNYWTVPF